MSICILSVNLVDEGPRLKDTGLKRDKLTISLNT